MGEEGVAEFTQDGPGYDALHVASPGKLGGRNLDLAAIPVRILDGGAVNHTIESCPESIGHAHGARLAGGIKCIALELVALAFFACQANGAQLGVRGGVVFYGYRIAGTHERFSALAVDNQGAKGHRPRGLETKSSEFDQGFEVSFIRRGGIDGRGWFNDLNGFNSHGEV
jgi:hypothetical protein